MVGQLWDGWDDDAVLVDRDSGVWADSARIHKVVPKSGRFRVEGPLLVPRSPQGWPVLAQAGQSNAGIAFAAKFAEGVFTVQNDLDLARSFYARLKQELAANGIPPGAQIDDLDVDQPLPLDRLVLPEDVPDDKSASRYLNIYHKAQAQLNIRQLIRDTVRTEKPRPDDRLYVPSRR